MFEFLNQLQWFELFGGLIALIVLIIVTLYAAGFTFFVFLWSFWTSAVFRFAVVAGGIGCCAWFIWHLIQKYGA